MSTTPDENFLNEELKKLLLSSLNSKKNSESSHTFKGIKPEEAQILFKMKDSSEKLIRDPINGFLEEEINRFEYKKWKNKLEDSFKKLLKLYAIKGDDCEIETLILIAKLYLLRSTLYGPKASAIPRGKNEALNKGLDYVDIVLNKKDPNNTSARQIKAFIYLELEKNKIIKTDYNKVISDAYTIVRNNIIPGEETSWNIETCFNIWFCLRYYETQEKVDPEKKDTDLNNIVNLSYNKIYFEKARAYYLLNKIDNMNNCFKKALKHISRHFSDPLWNDIVSFIKKLKENNNSIWIEFSRLAYYRCEECTKKTPVAFLQLHWSGLNDLYDLAFVSAKDVKDKAIIADSTKNRTTVPFSVWGREVDPEKISVTEAIGLNQFINISDALDTPVDSRPRKDIEDLPEDWIAVHLYINRLEEDEKFKYGKGHALIYDGGTKDWYEPEPFKINKLYESLLTWQANYAEKKIDAAPLLVELCKCIGEEMPFLFVLDSKKSIVLIPHDFLRRLPLHAAIKNNNEVWLEYYNHCYLPSWNLLLEKESQNPSPNGNYLFKNFKEYDYDELKKKFDSLNVKDPISYEYITKSEIHPENLFLLCHGVADTVNPYNSKLKLKDKPLAFRDVDNLKLDLNGSKLFLGACETDMLPPVSHTADEHLSLSSVFLNKGASFILSSMFEIKTYMLEKAFLHLFKKKNLIDSFNAWQKDELEKWREKYFSPEVFYNCVILRIFSNNFGKV